MPSSSATDAGAMGVPCDSEHGVAYRGCPASGARLRKGSICEAAFRGSAHKSALGFRALPRAFCRSAIACKETPQEVQHTPSDLTQAQTPPRRPTMDRNTTFLGLLLTALAASCAAQSPTLFMGMESGESFSSLTVDNNVNGAWAAYTAAGDICHNAAFLPNKPWNPWTNDIMGDPSKDFQNWCGLQLPCLGNFVMGKEGPCGKDQQYNRPDGTFYATLYDNGHGDVPVGKCVYDGTINKNCATAGSDIYQSVIRCDFDSPMC